MKRSLQAHAEQFSRLFEPPAVPVATGEVDDLAPVYARLPARFPELYEYLLVNYRWEMVQLPFLNLLANPGPAALLSSLLYDRNLADLLLPAGLIPFARAARGSYDPICFDLAQRRGKRDCRVVRVDHEEILSRFRIGAVTPLYATFAELVAANIAGSH